MSTTIKVGDTYRLAYSFDYPVPGAYTVVGAVRGPTTGGVWQDVPLTLSQTPDNRPLWVGSLVLDQLGWHDVSFRVENAQSVISGSNESLVLVVAETLVVGSRTSSRVV